MKIAIHANGDPGTAHVVEDWPHEWRLPVVGEHIEIESLSSTTLEVSSVEWVRRNGPNGATYWGVRIWVWGPALRREET